MGASGGVIRLPQPLGYLLRAHAQRDGAGGGQTLLACREDPAIPISYTIDRHKGIVRTVGRGHVTGDQLLDFARGLLSDSAVPHPIRDLHDLTGVEQFEVDATDVESILDLTLRDPERIRDGKVAVIATQDVVYGMSRMLSALAEFAPVVEQLRTQGVAPVAAVFREHQPALEWLLSEDQAAAS